MRKTMKVILLTLAFYCLSATAFSQSITLNLSNVTVKEAIQTLKEKTGYSFVYEVNDIDTQRKISVKTTNKSIEDVVKQVLIGQNVEFEIIGNNVVITKKAKLLSDKTETNQQNKSKKITGLVTDEKGDPIIGASVILKGSKTGTITDINGRYTLEAPANGQLQFSYIGYTTKTINVDDKSLINIKLTEDSKSLNEVVVVAYGVQKKVNLSGSVASINLENLGETRAVTSLSQSLQGAVSGLFAEQTSGQPGSDGASIMIRGQGTLNNSSPLVIVDGIVGSLSDVSPNDVANISVLKDAASSSIYGSRAANGVILVTTKQGSKEKTRITYNGYYGVQQPNFPIQVVDSYPQYMETINQAFKNSGNIAPYGQSIIDEWRANSALDPIVYPNTNWFNAVFKPAISQEHTVQASEEMTK